MHIIKKHILVGPKPYKIQNNSLPLECINKINKRKNAKQISTLDFSTLYIKIPHDILYKVVDFVFKGGTRDYIIINRQGCAPWSSNDDSTFEKHYKDICPTELELKKENNGNSCASFLDIYIYIGNGEFHTKLFDRRDNFGFDVVRMPLYCSNVHNRMFSGSIGAEFLRISRATSKTENRSRTCKQLLSRMLKQNGQMRRIKFSLIKMIQRHQKDFIKYNKSIEEVMQAIGF